MWYKGERSNPADKPQRASMGALRGPPTLPRNSSTGSIGRRQLQQSGRGVSNTLPLPRIQRSRSQTGPWQSTGRAILETAAQGHGRPGMAHTDPGSERCQPAMVIDDAKEVLRIGQWSVRQLGKGDDGLIYVDVATGRSQTEPPKEVLFALDVPPEGDDAEHMFLQNDEDPEIDGDEEVHEPVKTLVMDSSAAVEEEASSGQGQASPRFRRVVLTDKGSGVPLMMARDILVALREDASLFAQVQSRFSEYPAEPVFRMHEGLPEAVVTAAMELKPGQISDVISTETGAQIVLRIV